MRKLKLDLDGLTVESFPTSPVHGSSRGTVQGHFNKDPGDTTSGGSGSFDPFTMDSCGGTCFTCQFSCGGTCAASCGGGSCATYAC